MLAGSRRYGVSTLILIKLVLLEVSIDAEDVEWQAPAVQQFLDAFPRDALGRRCV